ncbi:hypothetical protein ABVT39_006085 [Epinephelus coioides]
MVLISPGQRLLHRLTASIFLQTANNFPAAPLRLTAAQQLLCRADTEHRAAGKLTGSSGPNFALLFFTCFQFLRVFLRRSAQKEK